MNSMGTPTGHTGQTFPPESLPVGNAVSEHETLLKYEAILNNASVGIAFTRDRAFQHANRAFEELFAWPADGLVGQSGMAVWGSPEEYAEVGSVVGPLLSQGKSVELERRMKRRDGTLFWCRLQARTDELARANDKLKEEVDERLQAEERARHLSLHDALTGLPNRRLLYDRLAQALAQARRERWQVAVMFLDLDRFKNTNDTLGHAAGDDVLREMSRRLNSAVRDSDTVARVGGDEFVIVLSHTKVETDLVPIAAKFLAELSVPCSVGDRELRVTPSIGVSVFPEDGLIEPSTFIPIAEDNELIIPIGEWVISEACQQMKRRHATELEVQSMAVNLSARQFFDSSLPERVQQALLASGLRPEQLELEITESILIANTEETMSLFARLRQLGVKLSIDDFGTGFSSLACLKRFHVDNLKIGHSFVRDIGTDSDDAAIMRAIVNLAQSLQLRVIAEGAETREQLDFLATCGCQEAQGFYFAHPQPAAIVESRAALARGWM